MPFSPPTRRPARRDALRARLRLEPLEGREVPAGLAPNVFPASQQFGAERAAVVFNGSVSGGAFFVSDMDDAGGIYTADILTTGGVVGLNTPLGPGLAAANDGTADVTLTGTLSAINGYLSSPGFEYRSGFFSGDATVTLRVVDPEGNIGSGTTTVVVSPDATGEASLAANTSTEQSFGPGPNPLAGLLTVAPWLDLDGSEVATVTIQLFGDSDVSGFTFTGMGSPATPMSPFVFTFVTNGFTDPAALQAALDGITVTPSAGFTGFVSLNVTLDIVDTAEHNLSGLPRQTANDSAQVFLDARVFTDDRTVTVPDRTVPKGTSIDLGGGQIAVSDADFMGGDTSVLTLSVPPGRGTLTVALPPGDDSGLTVDGSGTDTVTITGDPDEINELLATPGSVRYDPPGPLFSGGAVLTATFALIPLDDSGSESESESESFSLLAADPNAPPPARAVTATGLLALLPAATPLAPAVPGAVTNEDTPVSLPIAVPPPADSDASTTVTILIRGVPDGAVFDRGQNLGGGTWQFTPADLPGLVFTPPPNFSGPIDLTADVVVVDSAPDLGLSDTQVVSAPFRVTVIPVADPPSLSVADASGTEGDAIPLAVAAAPTDTDGSETVSVRVQGLPSGFTLSAGVFDPATGDWVLTPDQLAGLTVTAPVGSGGQTVAVTVVATSTESANGSAATTTATFALTVTAAAAPPPTAPAATPATPAPTNTDPITPLAVALFDFEFDDTDGFDPLDLDDDIDSIRVDDFNDTDVVTVIEAEVETQFVGTSAGFIPTGDGSNDPANPAQGSKGLAALSVGPVQSAAAAASASFAAERANLVPPVRPLDPTHFAAPPDGLQGDNLRWLDDLIRGYQAPPPSASGAPAPAPAPADGPRSEAPPAAPAAADDGVAAAPPEDDRDGWWRWLTAAGLLPLFGLSWWAAVGRGTFLNTRPARARREDAR